MRFEHQSGQEVPIAREVDDAGRTVFIIGPADANHLRWSQRVVARATSIRFEFDFAFRDEMPDANDVSVSATLSVADGAMDASEIPHETGKRPLPVPLDAGQAIVDWDNRYGWWPRPHYRVRGSSLLFYPFEDGRREAGGEDTLYYELTLP